MADETVNCPVCRYQVARTQSCERCGWQLSSEEVAGVVTADQINDFTARLEHAQQSFDLGAAVRAAASDPAALDRMLGLIRHGRPDTTTVRAAQVSAPTPPPGDALPTVVGPAIARLVTGSDSDQRRTLALVEIRRDGIATARLGVDAIGAPILVDPIDVTPWPKVLRWLPDDEDEHLLLLAGGVGNHRDDRVEEERDNSDPLRTLAGRADEIVVLHRLAGWPVPDKLAGAYRHSIRASEPTLSPEFVTTLARLAPLRDDYWLVLIDVDQRGVTRPAPRKLFAQGTVGRGDASADVLAPASGGQPVALAVVAGPLGRPARQCTMVRVERCQLTPGVRHRLEFRLDGPNDVTVQRPAGTTRDRDCERNWPDLLDEVPTVYQPDANAVDLVIGIELSGTRDTVARRRKLALEVIGYIEQHHSDPDSVHIGVIGYLQHRAKSRRGIVQTQELGPCQAAIGFLGDVPSENPMEHSVAAIEEALHEVRNRMWRARPVMRKFVLIGERRPYPTQDADVPRCPNGLDWQRELHLLERADIDHVAVWDRPSWVDRRARFSIDTTNVWGQLGRPRRPLLLDDVDARTVARTARALGATSRTPPLLLPLVAGTMPYEEHR